MLVHYLNVPSLEDSGKCSPLLCAVADRHDSVRWNRDDLLNQLKPMCTKPTQQEKLYMFMYTEVPKVVLEVLSSFSVSQFTA